MRPHRRILPSFAVVCLLLLVASAHAQARQTLRHHVRPAVSSGQALPVAALDPSQRLNLAIMLPLRNQDELSTLLANLYDPNSASYRHFLTVAQFTEQFGPSAADYQSVTAFAKAHGLTVTATPANRMLVDVSGSVAQINKAFHVTMTLYRHPTEQRNFYSPDREPSLDLSTPIAHIAGLNNFSLPRPMTTRASAGRATPASSVGSGPGGAYLGSDMRAAYYGGSALTGSGQAVGLLEFSGYDLSDVDLTFSNAGQSYTVPINNVLLDGATGQSNGDDGEEVIDIVQSISMAPGLSQVLVYIAPPVNDVDVFNQMAADNIAKQLSCSWLWEPEDASVDDPIFQEFAAQGQTLFVASGDYGAYTNFTNFAYYFPAEDAFITAVGGTDLTTTGPGGAWVSETAWNGIVDNTSSNATGGGISPDGISLPQWQSGLATALNGASRTSRNVPDVAAEASTDNYACDMGVCDGGWGGTSFGAPRWAGLLALVNQQLVSQGQSTAGFINPALYAIGMSSASGANFHDITVGNNDVTAGVLGGFNAVPGYDLVTGLGSPIGQALIESLPAPNFSIAASPNTLTVIGGGAAGTSVIALGAVSNFGGTVTLSASGLPKGVTASFNPPTISGTGTSKLSLKAGSAVTQGNANLTITGTSGTLTATTSVALSVDFAFSVTPATQTVTASQSVTYKAAVTMKSGFTGTVNLSVAGLPSGATGKFNPPSLSASGTSTLTVTTTSATPAGNYSLSILGTTGSLVQTLTAPLVVNTAATDFSLSASPNAVTIGQTVGSNIGTSTITITSQNNFSSPVTLSAAGVANGVTAQFFPNPVTPAPDGTATSILTLTEITWPAPSGNFPVIVTGTSGSEVATSNLTLTVQPLLFELAAGDANVLLSRGTTGSFTVNAIGPASFTSPVTLSLTGLPSGVTAQFTPNPMIPVLGYSGATVYLTASSTAPAGVYFINLVGTSGSFSTSINGLQLTVTPAGFTVTSSPTSISLAQGGKATSTITVTAQNGFAGKVGLNAWNLPDGLIAEFSPSSELNVPRNGSATATLKLAAAKSTTLGTNTITIAGGFWSPTYSLMLYNLSIPVTVTGSSATFVTLTNQFNLSGIEPDGWVFSDYTRGMDNQGHAYSGDLLSAWNAMWNGTAFTVSTQPDEFNVVQGAGQTIPLPAGNFSSLQWLGTGVNGQQLSQPFIVHYSDGTSTTITQSMSDWQNPQNFAGESKAFTMAYNDNLYNGGRVPRATYLYGYSFALNKAKTVASITLPKNVNVDALAMTLVP